MKKIFSAFLVTVMLFSVTAFCVPANALIDTSILYGDANGDGAVDTEDAQIVLKAAAGLESIKDAQAFERCDVNGDGYVTIYDARQILRNCAGLSTIQPTGAEGYAGFQGNGIIGSSVDAVNAFNAYLNNIKIQMPGFTRSEMVEIKGFSIANVTLSGITMGNTASSVTKAIEEMIVKESEPDAVQQSLKGTNCDNAMSAETETYVSRLKEGEVLGVTVTEDKATAVMTITVALADGELDNISQTAFDDVFNTDILRENADTVVANVFGANAGSDGMRKTVKNCVLTAQIDRGTGEVISYTTEYEIDTYIAQSNFGLNGGILSAKLTGVKYTTKVTVIYNDFQW